MKHLLKVLRSAITVVLLVNGSALADEADTLARIDKQLAELKTFQYERGGDPLRDLENTIFQLPADSPLRAKIEDKLIEALDQSNEIGRGIICRQLRVVGTDKCIPAIAPLLTDPKLADFARYALQGMGSDAASKAMHKVLGKTSGTLQVGLINSLAACNYEPLRGDCIRLIQSEDSEVATAAIRALGKLGGVESVKALISAKSKTNEQLAADIDLAIVKCADKLVRAGEREKAKELFATLYKQGGPSRLAALRGLVMADPHQCADLLAEAIRGQDRRLAMLAISLTPQATGNNVTEKFVAILRDLPAEAKVPMLKALGERGDQGAVAAVIDATKSDNAQIRLAAVEALGGFSGMQAIDTLIEIATNGDEPAKRVARASLARIDSADSRLATIAQNSDEKRTLEAIQALASRRAGDQCELLLQLARDGNPIKRRAAIDALGILTDAKNVDSLLQLALEKERADDLPAIEQSFGRVLLRIKSPADRARPILDALSRAPAGARSLLIRQLAKAGTPDALDAVRKALQSSDSPLSDAAVFALANWPNPAASDDLIKLIETAGNAALRKTALDGYIQIASDSDDPSAMFLDALKRVSNVDNKRRVLNEMGLNCESFEAVAATQSLLEDPQLGSTAAIATIRIAYKLRLSHKDEARKILEHVLATVDDPDVQKRAQNVLNDLDKYEDHIRQWVAIGPFVDKTIESGEQSYKQVYEPDRTDTSKLEWKPLELGIGDWDINLEATYGPIDHCAAYVRTMIWSPVDQEVQIEGGCDDALKMWVNGEIVFDDYSVRGGSPRKMLAPARLRKGWNELKLKAVDDEGGWAFGCRVRKPNGTKLDGLKYEAR
jgi:HEAT repeat protein